MAIFLALTTGAYAISKAPKNSVVSKSIKNGGVKLVDLGADSVDSTKVVNDSLTGDDVNESSLKLAAGTGGTVKSVGTGAGLTGGPITESGTVALQGCPNTLVLKSNGSGYACAADEDTTYGAVPGGGIQLTGDQFGVVPCSAGEILKSNGTGYACALDENTTYSADPAGGLALSGSNEFSIANDGVGTNQVRDGHVAGGLRASDVGRFTSLVVFDMDAAAAGACNNGTVFNDAVLTGTTPTDFVIVTTTATVPPGVFLVGRAVTDAVGLNVCNMTAAPVDIPLADYKILVIDAA